MFLTQCWGTIFGGFISYVVMVSIVTANEALLTEGDGNASWSGATMQSYNTNATAWALAAHLYKAGQTYFMVPIGLAIGAAAVIVHRIFAHVCFVTLWREAYRDLSLRPSSSCRIFVASPLPP